jgi:preprotein translocase subunit YajC
MVSCCAWAIRARTERLGGRTTMNLLAPAALFLAATSTKPKSSSSSLTIILFIGVIATAGYFFFIRPRRMQQQRQKSQSRDYEIGDEILTVGGIVGRVISIDGDRITIISGEPDYAGGEGTPTRIVLVKNAIARKMEPEFQYDDGAGDHTGDSNEHTGVLPEGHPMDAGSPEDPDKSPGDPEA